MRWARSGWESMTLLRDIREDINKWRDKLRSRTGRLSHDCVCGKMLISYLNGITKSQMVKILWKDLWEGLLSLSSRLIVNYRSQEVGY